MSTMLGSLIEHLRAKDLALDGQARPVAVLWTDPKGEWRALIEMIQTHVEELLVLGDYRPEGRSGPAVWIRCLVDRALDEPALPEGRAPIVYLPGVARQDLRAGEECSEGLRPLVELMYRGTMWLQHNGSDWNVMTFLTSPKALGLSISRDEATTQALLRALTEVAVTPLVQFSAKRLDADYFNQMLSADVVRDLLRWMGDPTGTRARLGDNGWEAFRNVCRDKIDFDPETEADVTAGERLGAGKDAWAGVWERFVESPTSYGDIAGLLRRSCPTDAFRFDRERWPDLNDEDESTVRAALDELKNLPHGDACDAIARLEEEHGKRRSWVWTRLGQSPMAELLAPLSQLAIVARTAIGGTKPDEFALAHVESGWLADTASWEAMAKAPNVYEVLVGEVVRHLLEPWLEDSSRAFQKAVADTPLPTHGDQPLVEAGEDVCILFVDGLRYDLGRRLGERLEGRGCRVTVNHRWAAVPTVTATAKPAVTPVADGIVGGTLGETFAPILEKGSKPAGAQNLRSAMQERGYQILGKGKLDFPESQPARGWIEAGQIDSLGHKLEGQLARQIDDELARLTDRIITLLDAGWKSIRIVTDHGWLLLPGGLPKVDLPKHLTASRWSRCAVIAGGATPDVMRVPWHWNSSQSFATAPGIACFNKSDIYAHGGLSVQECLIPDVLVERGGEEVPSASITSITWRSLRCFVETATSGADVSADLRLGRASGPSVVAASKRVDSDGATSLVLVDDEHETAQLVLVLLDDAGNILSQRPTQVGVDA